MIFLIWILVQSARLHFSLLPVSFFLLNCHVHTLPLSVRRATTDDLANLRSLWSSMHLSGDKLERRLTEFQVVVDATGAFLGAILTAFHLLQTFGLPQTLILVSTFNILAGAAFVMIGSRLKTP